MSAALIGSGVGLSLGAAYLAGGMAQHAAEHSRVARIAEAAAGGYSDAVLQDEAALRLTQQSTQQPAGAFVPGSSRQLAALNDRLQAKGDQAPASAQRDLECLTQAIYYEARGESRQGQFAVAQVVMNRVKHPAFPQTVCGVVYQGAGKRKGCQFSFACDGSMRQGREAQAWNEARKVASRVLAGAAVADIGSATHFHTTGVAPAWGAQMRRVAQVGVHVFYKFGPRGVIQAPEVAPAVLTAGLPEKPIEYRLTKTVNIEAGEETADATPLHPAPAHIAPHAAPAAAGAGRPAVDIKPAPTHSAKGADSAVLKATPASAAAAS